MLYFILDRWLHELAKQTLEQKGKTGRKTRTFPRVAQPYAKILPCPFH